MDLDFLLIRKMKQGDDEAFELFIHKYYKDILSYCKYHCADKGYARLRRLRFVKSVGSLTTVCLRLPERIIPL